VADASTKCEAQYDAENYEEDGFHASCAAQCLS
jgi:hypothetical protein